ncbi:hypothetical protein PG993_014173 [Apiospora rasikravindrae]|uniref:Uncharacterized protein n=1 Tax=Apiospora rasikravindrae TaxID=990691 RepID=A0ABR1RSH2_9PEZI
MAHYMRNKKLDLPAVGLPFASPAVARDQPDVTTITVRPPPTPTSATTTPCPVVTSVGICPSCTSTQIPCIKVSTVYDNLPGCPSPAPTSIVDYFCDFPCPPKSCSTLYIYPDRPTDSWVSDAAAPTAN